MKQVVTNKSGALTVLEVPAPAVRPGFVLVRTGYSLISPGTEGAQVREGKAGLLTKAREHPEQVKQVLSKLLREGIRAAASQVKDRLDQWRPLGYSLAGTVVEAGEGVSDLAPGDRVACAGAGYAVHAEMVCVPRNLVARLPAEVSVRDGAFATLGAIALHGVRQARPALGETALVVGLGVVGQLAAQFLRAAGVRVAVTDPDPERVKLARDLGADLAPVSGDPAAELGGWTRGVGLDMVVVCAATPSSDPVREAARLLRDRGRMVVVGDVGLDLERGPFYSKEIEFSLSRSYGPGRYDPVYEEGGVDYPVGYVRWTEGRNLGAVLDLIARGEVRVGPLVSEEVPVDRAGEAFDRILAGEGGMGILIAYRPEEEPPARTLDLPAPRATAGETGILLVGGGWFARTHHLPNLAAQRSLRLAGVVSRTGANARQLAEKSGAAFAGTDLEEALSREDVDAVLLCTRHDLHVPHAVMAIEAGKHVLVEKPLALDLEGLRRIARALEANPVRLAVGFNRRHAPLARELAGLLDGRQGPLHGTYRMNAGRLPRDHWVNDPVEGGGRILGEACHAFDFLNHLAGSPPVGVQAAMLRSPDPEVVDEDNLTATVTYADGSVLTVVYSTQGPRDYPKEQIEIVAPDLAVRLTDFRELVWRGARSGRKTLRTEDKGQAKEMAAWARYLAGEEAGIVDFQAGALTTWLTIRALEAARGEAALPVADALADALRG